MRRFQPGFGQQDLRAIAKTCWWAGSQHRHLGAGDPHGRRLSRPVENIRKRHSRRRHRRPGDGTSGITSFLSDDRLIARQRTRHRRHRPQNQRRPAFNLDPAAAGAGRLASRRVPAPCCGRAGPAAHQRSSGTGRRCCGDGGQRRFDSTVRCSGPADEQAAASTTVVVEFADVGAHAPAWRNLRAPLSAIGTATQVGWSPTTESGAAALDRPHHRRFRGCTALVGAADRCSWTGWVGWHSTASYVQKPPCGVGRHPSGGSCRFGASQLTGDGHNGGGPLGITSC